MIFRETELKGAYIIEPEKLEDERGFFARSYCHKEFEKHGLNPRVVQCNISYNAKKGTLRGMHYQYPKWEAKLVRVTRGSIFDVIIDLRAESSSYTQHFTATLSDENRKMLFIPEGFAHGFQALEDHTEIFYQMSEFYFPGNDRGIRYNDPIFAIRWPEDVNSISKRDLSYPDFIPQFNDDKRSHKQP